MDVYENVAAQALESLVGTIRLDKKEYAVSLIWSSVEAIELRPREQARQAAQRVGSDLFALRAEADRKRFEQYALGDYALGHKSGMPALASCVADVLSDSLYGVWPLGIGVWWLVGIRSDGMIVLDRASCDEDEIRKMFEQGLLDESWSQVVCPTAWQIPGSLSAEQDAPLLGPPRVKLRVVNIDIARFVLWGACGGILLILGLFIRSWWPEPEPIVLPAKPVPPPPAPWFRKPPIEASLRYCTDVLQTYSLEAASIAGWFPVTGRCDGNQFSYQLKRRGGLDHWLSPLAVQLMGSPQVRLWGAKNQAELQWQASELPSFQADHPGNPNLSVVQARLKAEFDELGFNVQFEFKDGFWPSLKLTTTIKQSPVLLLPLFTRLSATVINEVTYNVEDDYWILSAEIYGASARMRKE
ncbi:type 4b pilus protein PilO2 [Aeromonas sp. MdU4]|uniref:type 4b pilus protein PilO2 n=1 Tax=Aeromonas sp. MdU4 TaxID=3342819 RepID=UPI0035B7CE59